MRRVPDVLTFDRPVVFFPGKNRPILFTAADSADLLLTLDRRDFIGLLGRQFYGLPILEPRDLPNWVRAGRGRLPT